jgi:hypothetical protein
MSDEQAYEKFCAGEMTWTGLMGLYARRSLLEKLSLEEETATEDTVTEVNAEVSQQHNLIEEGRWT